MASLAATLTWSGAMSTSGPRLVHVKSIYSSCLVVIPQRIYLPGVEMVDSGVAAVEPCLNGQPERGEARKRRGGDAGEDVESVDVAMEVV